MPATQPFIPLGISILTVSDTRDEVSDTSGQYLCEAVTSSGHILANYKLVKDDKYQIRAIVSHWITAASIQAVITTGGTGYDYRDCTPEAIEPLCDRHIDGFGELFRQISYVDIGSSTVQSRAFGGIANRTLLFCLPGSTNACKTGWEKILKEQLNYSHLPCNFVPHCIPLIKDN